MESKIKFKYQLSIAVSTIIKAFPLLVLFYYSYSCSTTILHKSDLKKDYDFARKNQIGIYTIPSENNDFNEAYSNALQLYFLTKGYGVKDINCLLHEYSDSIPETRFRKIAEY